MKTFRTIISPVLLSLAISLSAYAQVAAPDSDNDGVPDSEDRCPMTAGSAEHGGCPEEEGSAGTSSKNEKASVGELGPKLLKVISAAGDNFSSIQGEVAKDDKGVLRITEYKATTELPGANCYIRNMMGTNYIADYGTFNSFEEASSKMDEVLKGITAALGKDYEYRESKANPEYNEERIWFACRKTAAGFEDAIIQLGFNNRNGARSLYLMVLGGKKKTFTRLTKPQANTTEFSKALNKLYEGTYNEFANVKGAKHEENDLFSTVWYEITPAVPGAGCRMEEGGLSLDKGCSCAYPGSADLNAAKTKFNELLEKIKPALGSEFAYHELDPIDSQPRKIIFAKANRSGLDTNHSIVLSIIKDYNNNYYVEVFFGDILFF